MRSLTCIMLRYIVTEMAVMAKNISLVTNILLPLTGLWILCTLVLKVLAICCYNHDSINHYIFNAMIISSCVAVYWMVINRTVQELRDGILLVKITQQMSKMAVMLAENICDIIFSLLICSSCGVIGLYFMGQILDLYKYFTTIVLIIPILIAMTRCHVLIFTSITYGNRYILNLINVVLTMPLLILSLDYIGKHNINHYLLYLFVPFCIFTYTFASAVLIEYIDVTK